METSWIAALGAIAGLLSLIVGKVWKTTQQKREARRLDNETEAERFVREARELLKEGPKYNAKE